MAEDIVQTETDLANQEKGVKPIEYVNVAIGVKVPAEKENLTSNSEVQNK